MGGIGCRTLFARVVGSDRSVAMEPSVAEDCCSDQSNPGAKGVAIDRQRFAIERRSLQYVNKYLIIEQKQMQCTKSSSDIKY